jgi:hypothetical protein
VDDTEVRARLTLSLLLAACGLPEWLLQSDLAPPVRPPTACAAASLTSVAQVPEFTDKDAIKTTAGLLATAMWPVRVVSLWCVCL